MDEKHIKACSTCTFSLFVYNDYNHLYKFMCGFKLIWHSVPTNIFMNMWLGKRGEKIK